MNCKDKSLLIVCGTLASGGAERVISILSKPFADAFRQVWILTWREGPQFYKIDSRVSLISLNEIADSNNPIKKGVGYRKLLIKLKPSCILSFLTPFNMLSLLFSLGINTPKLVAERNDPRFIKGDKPIALLRDLLYKSATKILCQTPSIKAQFNHNFQNKIDVIFNPIIMDENKVGTALKNHKKKTIVCVARLHPQKNHILLLDSFREFLKTHSDYQLLLYGEGEYRPMIEEYIATIGLNEKVSFMGAQKNIHNRILDSTMFVMTSKYEGMPNALLEAMCLGLPCISTPVSGAVDLIQSGENGILVEPQSQIIAEAMANIADNPNLAKSIGMKAKDLYQKLHIDKISRQWIACISDSFKD